MKKLSHLLEYALLRGLLLFLAALPEKARYAAIRILALAAFDLLRLRRKITLDNLAHALGRSHSEAERLRIGRESYFHIGMTFLEMLLAGRLTPRLNTMLEIPEIETIKGLRRGGKGVVVVTGHFGSWELSGAAVTAAGLPFTVTATRQANPYVDRYITRCRNALGMEVVSPDASIKQLVRVLKDGGCVGMVADQHAGRHGIPVHFFGRPAATFTGPAQLALKYKVPMVLNICLRLAPGRYRLKVREVEIREDDTAQSLTRRYTAMLEEVIRRHPEQYFWMHRRWKKGTITVP